VCIAPWPRESFSTRLEKNTLGCLLVKLNVCLECQSHQTNTLSLEQAGQADWYTRVVRVFQQLVTDFSRRVHTETIFAAGRVD
jgi:hypothetical protein